ncbi:sensor histidine kinase [Microbacterium foliorum]|uniref:sensor histidine kinase n=2 Tax=Microbacterium foliorum TaxID=104336 RepID=UPI001D4BA0C2|nr:histidine kinase [Microbacterium foliorum]CAH0249213.1 Sensor histidine kinase LiaS [Microbacterium foliorum]
MSVMHEAKAERLREWYRTHRPAADALLITLFALLAAALGFMGVWSMFSLLPTDLSPWWTLATALPACVLVLTKHRAPMLSLVGATVVFAVDLLTIGGLGPLVVLLDVLWTAAFVASPRARSRLLAALALATVVLFAAALALSDTSIPVAFLVAVQFGAFVGTDYWWAVAVSQANELAELHRRRAEDGAIVAERDRAEAVRRERETMARELHDVVAGHVMAMAIRAEAALSTAPEQTADRAALRAVRDAGLDAHGALRSMISVLRRGDGELSPTPRLGDLLGVVDDAERAGLVIRFTQAELDAVDTATEQATVRVVREALANCIRHASGAEVEVVIEEAGDGILVRVISRGGVALGSAAYSGGGWGLDMLRERVHALGGVFSAGPEADGWSVEARLPQRGAR